MQFIGRVDRSDERWRQLHYRMAVALCSELQNLLLERGLSVLVIADVRVTFTYVDIKIKTGQDHNYIVVLFSFHADHIATHSAYFDTKWYNLLYSDPSTTADTLLGLVMIEYHARRSCVAANI